MLLQFLRNYTSLISFLIHDFKKTWNTLELQWYQICDEGVKHLTNALQHNRTLTTLNIYDNGIRDKGAGYLIVSTFYLGENLIGDQGEKYLANALQQNQTLTTLDLISNKISDNIQERINRMLENNA